MEPATAFGEPSKAFGRTKEHEGSKMKFPKSTHLPHVNSAFFDFASLPR